MECAPDAKHCAPLGRGWDLVRPTKQPLEALGIALGDAVLLGAVPLLRLAQLVNYVFGDHLGLGRVQVAGIELKESLLGFVVTDDDQRVARGQRIRQLLPHLHLQRW